MAEKVCQNLVEFTTEEIERACIIFRSSTLCGLWKRILFGSDVSDFPCIIIRTEWLAVCCMVSSPEHEVRGKGLGTRLAMHM